MASVIAKPAGELIQERALAGSLRLPVTAWVVSRLAVLLIGYLAVPLLPFWSTPPPYHLFGTENILLDVFASRWDTGFYLSIADEGYTLGGTGFPSVPFFPLYPLLIRALSVITGSTAAAGLILSNLFLLGAAVLVHAYGRLSWDQGVADRAVWYLMLFPVSFFGSTVYSESLFLFLAAATFYLAQRSAWESAGLTALLAALTRLVGILLAPVLLLLWWQGRRDPDPAQRPSRAWLLVAAAPPVGTLAYMAYLQVAFGDGLAFVHASAAWAREPRPIWELLATLLRAPAGGWPAAIAAGQIPASDLFDVAMLLLFFVGGLILLRRRPAEAAFVLLGVLVAANSGLLMSQRRYMWVLFPLFYLLGDWGRRPAVDRTITLLFAAGLALFTAMFAKGFWVA